VEPPTLTHPERLWVLLLLPLLWWLLQPLRPRVVLLTAHLRQWLLAQARLRRRPIRRHWPRLLLLLLAFCAGVLAMAGPTSAGRTGAHRLMVLLDGSASMAAAAPDGSPFHKAVARLRRELARLPAAVEVQLLQGGRAPRQWRGRDTIIAAQLPAPAGTLPWSLPALAQALADPDTAVWTLTDGQHLADPPAGMVSTFGAPAADAAIVAVRLHDQWPLAQLQLEVDVVRTAPDGGATTGELTVEGAVAAVPPVPVNLPSGVLQTLPLVLTRAAAGGELRLRLSSSDDALPADDTFGCRLPPLPAPRIAVLAEAESGPAIHAAAAALAEELAGTVVEARAGEAAGLLLVEGGVAAVAPGKARALYFGTRDQNSAPPLAAANVAVIDWDRTDPLLAGLDLSELSVRTALRDALPPGKVLLWGQLPGGARQPLLVTVTGEQATSLHFAFRLQDSNLWLLPALPQLLHRALLAAHGQAPIRPDPGNLLDAGESDLRACATTEQGALPPFAAAGSSLAPWFLLAAMVALVLRGYVR